MFDPTDSYGTEQIEAKQNAIGILQNKFVLAIDGQAQEMSYSMMPSELQKKDVIAGLNQNKAMIVTVLSALIFLVTAAGKFIEVSFLALIGLIIKNSQKNIYPIISSGSFLLIPSHFQLYSLQSCGH